MQTYNYMSKAPSTSAQNPPKANIKRGSGKKDSTMVTVKQTAYIKMKKHVLRFASNVKDPSEFKEVMGIIMGRLVDGKNPQIKDVIIEDAIPVNHGGAVEVAFAPEDYVNFSILDQQFADKGMFAVGWYHSHPALSCFFSAVDIRNQLGFQAANPAAVGLVFDHTRFQDPDDLGFDAYRLDDPSQGPMSDYHEVDWTVETPEDFTFYMEGIKTLMDSYHKGEPPLLELSEVPDVFGDLALPGRNAMMAKEPELNFVALQEKFSKNINEFTNAFFQPLIKFMNEWAQSISKGLIEKNIHLLEVVVELKTNLSKALAGLQSWFKFQLNDQLRNIDVAVDDQLENLTNQRGELLGKIDEVDTTIKTKLAEAFTKALGATLNKITQDMTSALNKFTVLLTQTSPIVDKVSSQKALVSQGLAEFNTQLDSIKKSTESLSTNLDMTLTTSVGPLSKDIEAVVDQQKDMLDTIKVLKNMVAKI